MRFTTFVLTIAACLVSQRAFSDDSFQVLPPGRLGRAMRDVTRKRRTPDKPPKAGPGKIVGHCTMPAALGEGDQPCVDFTLVLNNKDGSEALRTRTDKNGNFLFEATEHTEYMIASGSKFAEVVTPKSTIESGQNIEVKLMPK